MHTDEHLLEILRKYDGWMKEGLIPYAGRVLPVPEAVPSPDWVLPTQQAVEILRTARTLAVGDCVCRSHYRRCDHPLRTCLLMNDVAQAFIKAGGATPIHLKEAELTLRIANLRGLVHQAVYRPKDDIWAVCSCCPCCCYRLQMLRQFGREDLVVRSDFIAHTDAARCTDCAVCVTRCVFRARQMVDGKVVFASERCYGCGLCVTTCPEEAVTLDLRGDADTCLTTGRPASAMRPSES
jgi:ferredoxin